MLKSIKHLTGSAIDWLTYDIVIPKGEIAIEIGTFGRVRMKIGNGTSAYSALPYVDGNYKRFSNELTLRHGFSFRSEGQIQSLAVTLPLLPDPDFFCDFSFLSGADPTEFYFTSGNIYFTGDSTADGEFLPDANMRYTVFVWFDGRFEGVVRGIPYV